MAVGLGLNSLIPPKDPKDSGQNAGLKEEKKEVPKGVTLEEKNFSGQAMSEERKETEPEPIKYREQEERLVGMAHGVPHKRPPVSESVFWIEVDNIRPNPHQPRKHFDEEGLKELASSIREFGILQPLVVSKIEKEIESGTKVEYELVAGERRWRAAQMVGLERVPAIVRKFNKNSEQLELAIIENLQRSDLNMIETARAYARLQDEFGLTQREIAQRLGKSREAVSNTLRLLNLPSDIQEALSQRKINESQARLLLAIENPVAQQQLFAEIISNNLSVREAKSRMKRLEEMSAREIKNQEQKEDAEISQLEERLSEVLGTRVNIDRKGDGGQIIIRFYSPEEVYGIIKKINPADDF